jgi:pimeloyl-ACP methyl ester carboxylesterase
MTSHVEKAIERFASGMFARVRLGQGDGVLWVHGYTLDSTVWTDIWSNLAEWNHIAIDLPGHGCSDLPHPGATLEGLGEQLAEAALGHQVRHVVGLSLGSMFALQIILARPSAFETLTLAAPGIAGGPVERSVGVRYMQLHDLYRQRGPGPWMTELWMRSPPETFAGSSESLHARLATLIDRHRWREFDDPDFGIGGFARHPQNPGLLAASSARLLILVGQHELSAFRRTAHILHSIRPDARVVELAGAGHLCLLHVPAQSARLLVEHWRGPESLQRLEKNRDGV